MPAEDARLSEFLEWASANGVRGNLIADYRRVAGELLALSNGGRVTESHILRLIDSYADRAGGRAHTTLIETVGEAMLRHESARRLSLSSAPATPTPTPTPTPVPAASSPPPQPRPVSTPPPSGASVPTPPPPSRAPAPAPRRASAETFTARPSERISVELKPPSVSREPSTPPPLVSFSPTPDQPSAPVSPVAPASVPPPPVMLPPQPRRRSASQFRCYKCKSMVTADDTGVCPRCGTAAPRISSSQVNVVTPPRSARWLLPALIAVAAFVIAFRFGPALVDRVRHPSESVAGTMASTHLGVRHTFPDGWRHATDTDRAPASTATGFQAVIPEPVSLRSARFFRGAIGDPGAELLLAVAPRPPGVTDEAFENWATTAAAAPAALVQTVREVSGVSNLRIERCVVGQSVPGGGMRCVGGASRTRALVYAWPARTVTAIAVFLTVENPDAALDEANELIAGLDLS